MMVSVEWQ